MTLNTCKAISPEIKNKIITESFSPGCHLGNLAEKYNIPIKTLLDWRRKHSLGKQSKDVSLNNGATRNQKFLPVSLNPDNEISPGESSLKAASLEFHKFTISIQGKFTTTLLSQIIQSVTTL
jgi:transposase-like protein